MFVLTGALEREELDFDLLDFFSLEPEAFLDSLVEKFLSGSARIESATKVGGSGLANAASSCKVTATIELFSAIPQREEQLHQRGLTASLKTLIFGALGVTLLLSCFITSPFQGIASIKFSFLFPSLVPMSCHSPSR